MEVTEAANDHRGSHGIKGRKSARNICAQVAVKTFDSAGLKRKQLRKPTSGFGENLVMFRLF